jgi:subtilase family serine protease
VLNQTIAKITQTLPMAVANLETPSVSLLKAEIQSHIQQQENALERLPLLVREGILDEASANLRAYTLRSQLSSLQQQVSQLPPENLPQIAQTLSSQEFWQDLSEAERRVYLREFIRAVWIVRQGDRWNIQIQFVF